MHTSVFSIRSYERSSLRSIIGITSITLCLVIAGCSSITNHNADALPTQSKVALSISPSNAALMPGQQLQLNATVIGTTNQAVTWEVNGVAGGNAAAGTISSSGVYWAPANVPASGGLTIEAVSIADASTSGTAAITISDVVTISPRSASVAIGTNLQFTSTMNGSVTSPVAWSVNGIAGGNASIGTVTSSGLYQAPPAVPAATTVKIGAVDPTDSVAFMTASVTVFDPAIQAAHSEWLAGVAAAAATYGCDNPLVEQQSTESVSAAISRFGLTATEGSCLVLLPVSTIEGSLRYSIAWGGTVNGIDILYISDVSQMRVWNGAAVAATPENASMISAAIQVPSAQSITLSPGSDIQSAVSDAPEGTTFFLLPGVYRMQSVKPKNGDAFVGQGTVNMNGAKVLTFSADASGSGLWVATAPVILGAAYPCQTSSPLCDQIQDLFIDNVLQQPAVALSGLTAGSWYIDQGSGQVYVPSDPTGHVVEIGAQSSAFYGTATGVQISNVTVEKYANHAQQGVIGNGRENSGWTVDSVEVRWNHGAGLELGENGTLSHSFIHHNGQIGIVMGGVNCQALNNEDSWNNYAGFDTFWEAGGSKFWATTNLLVQGNYVHDNNGFGLWTDTDNVGTVYTGNTVITNFTGGILHEVSFSSIISNNNVMGNGNMQIELANSSNGEVYGNTVEVLNGRGDGIVLSNANRGSGPLGAYIAAHDHVHDNTVTYMGANGYSGIVDTSVGSTAIGNSFDSDRYILKIGSRNSSLWMWFNGMDWSGFQVAGQEANGTCCN